MLLSTERKFIFVHVPKTAGSSLHNALVPFSRTSNRTLFRSFLRRTPIVESPEHAHFRIHETAKKIRSKISPQVWDTYFSFAVVRNPFDHAVSHYEYLKQYRNKLIADEFSKITFNEYLDIRLSQRKCFDRLFIKLPNQSYFLCEQGNVLVDHVYKFEHLSEGVTKISQALGGIDLKLTRINVTKANKKNILEYYANRQSISSVLSLYEKDFELFDYIDAPQDRGVM